MLRKDFDQAGFACAGWAIQQQPQLVGITWDTVLASAMLEVVQDLYQSVLLGEEQTLKRLVSRQFVSSVRSLFCFFCLRRNHLVHIPALVLGLHLALQVQIPLVRLVNKIHNLFLFEGLDGHLRSNFDRYVRTVFVWRPIAFDDFQEDRQTRFNLDPFLLRHLLGNLVVRFEEPNLRVFFRIVFVAIIVLNFDFHVVILQ
mmetsp:Transcript_2694/g.6323  ORF Transcript_2694/g.6323 Transcript_2694/m.6323 type:complete len:200 (+) Transcript_2694:1044-1643(+)